MNNWLPGPSSIEGISLSIILVLAAGYVSRNMFARPAAQRDNLPRTSASDTPHLDALMKFVISMNIMSIIGSLAAIALSIYAITR